jgi:exopolyphosphatase / guanosine-5'-triphosphate,3'-diphosphate pyrophosphatase
MVALALRAHRKQSARLDSPEWQALSAGKRRIARAMAAILRVADALDRSHRGVVKNVAVLYSPRQARLEIASNGQEAALEVWTCEKRIDLLAKLLDRRLILQN